MSVDRRTLDGFGDEWSTYDQAGDDPASQAAVFRSYFSLVDWQALPDGAVAVDVGCGSGRWAARVAPLVGQLVCIDASPRALGVAAKRLAADGVDNAGCLLGAAGSLPLADGSADLVYSLGVLHHVPDTFAALADCARVVRPGGRLLVYLYYALDGRPAWFRALWRASDAARRVVSRLPFRARLTVTRALAVAVYWPLARLALVAERRGANVERWPLALYRDKSLYMMRTDALDRFGTALEQRYTRAEVQAMLERAGLVDVAFRDGAPYWCAIGRKPG